MFDPCPLIQLKSISAICLLLALIHLRVPKYIRVYIYIYISYICTCIYAADMAFARIRTYMPFCLQLLAPACPQHVLPLAGRRPRVQSDNGRPAAGTEELGRYCVQKGVWHAKFQSPAQAVRAANVRRACNRSRQHQHAAQVHNKRYVNTHAGYWGQGDHETLINRVVEDRNRRRGKEV